MGVGGGEEFIRDLKHCLMLSQLNWLCSTENSTKLKLASFCAVMKPGKGGGLPIWSAGTAQTLLSPVSKMGSSALSDFTALQGALIR